MTVATSPNPSSAATPTTSPVSRSGGDQVDDRAGNSAPTRPDRHWLHRVWRGPESDPSWARPALWGLLASTALLYLWNLTANGWANGFYSAAVQAGSSDWKAFLFGSLDGANSITVDKPPAALWVMEVSVRIFGLNSFAILLPEVLMGVATVGLVYAAVKRYFSPVAGLIAGAVLALTPVAVLMFRFNNPDALLTLLIAFAAFATLRAIEHGSIKWFVWVGVALGVGFLTKTLQVMTVVPGFGLTYLICANTSLSRRISGAVAGTAAMVLSAGWWVALVELVPASSRPYIGGSQTNSFLELTFGYNGLGRINGGETGAIGPNTGGGTILRMFSNSLGGQVSWLLPSALILLVMGFVFAGRAPRTDMRRASYAVWGSWLVVTGLTFSLMEGIFHEYYTIALAPAIGAIVGMGAWDAWQRRDRLSGSMTLAVATATAGVWAFVLLSRTIAYGPVLRVAVLAAGAAAAIGFVLIGRVDRRAIPAVIATAAFAVFAGPLAYSLSTVSTAHAGSIPIAGPGGQGGPGGPGGGLGGGPGGPGPGFGGPDGGPGLPPPGMGAPNGQAPIGPPPAGQMPNGQVPNGGMPNVQPPNIVTPGPVQPGQTPPGQGPGGMSGLLNGTTPDSDVVAALSANADDYTWVAATVGSQNAAGLQLGSGHPVMAIGGFNGSDPSPTLEQFQSYVDAGEIHYFLAGGGFGPQRGGSNVANEINTWVTANYTSVAIGNQTFYDLTKPSSGAAS